MSEHSRVILSDVSRAVDVIAACGLTPGIECPAYVGKDDDGKDILVLPGVDQATADAALASVVEP